MKINGTNQVNLNPYKQQLQNQAQAKKAGNKQDQVEISEQAKHMQQTEKPDPERAARVQEIKDAVDKGNYKVNPEKTAQKMLDFWSGH
ncbi:flagellar biosynthesis anti-sigma factor FlgM [Virgibacillus sediminis]|uniref:Negative regulator of flagellin synthesis n=1 Tax=Virgibacillus sediminis TaxID=202260 RepID=A0ABV7A2T5_9BACI